MNIHTIIFSLFYLFPNTLALLGDLDYDTKLNIIIDHSFDDSITPTFIHRGDISAKSVHSDVVTFKQNEMSQENIRSLKALAKKNGNYRIRALVKTTNGKEYLFYTFLKACSLTESHLKDVMFVNLDSMGNVIAITSAAPAICTEAAVEDKHLVYFNTTVIIRHMDLGPVPDTASYIQKLEREREAKERGEGKDNRSFLSKYWMYILPVVILFFLPNTSNTESSGNAQR